jgi:hypothetical protein
MYICIHIGALGAAPDLSDVRAAYARLHSAAALSFCCAPAPLETESFRRDMDRYPLPHMPRSAQHKRGGLPILKVLSIGTLYCKCTRALNFERNPNFSKKNQGEGGNHWGLG